MSTSSAEPAQKRATVASLRQEMAVQTEASAAVLKSVKESLAHLQLALEDRGWARLGNQYEANGLDLKTIQLVSEDLRAQIVGGGLMKAIVETRGSTIYGDGFGLKGFSKAAGKFFANPNNVLRLFSAEAFAEINRAHATDGQVLFLVHKRTKEIIRVGLADVGAPYIDSRDKERLWYVRHSYQEVTPANPKGETKTVYYVADTCPTAQANRTSINEGAGIDIKVDQDYTAVLWAVNLQVGWPLGIPDLLASLQWAEKYTGFLKNQDRFAEALAAIAWQAHAANADAAKRVGAVVSEKKPAGSTSVQTADVELRPMTGSAVVSFENGRPLAAQAAVAAGLTVNSILGDAETGAATTLDPHEKKMASLRRDSATAFLKRIGKLLGAPKLEIIWPDFETESPYREAQMIVAAAGTGLFAPDELRGPLAERMRLRLEEGSSTPDGYLQPNNSKTDDLAAKRTAAAGGAVDGNQGQSTGVGKLSDGDNTSRDLGEV